MLTADNVMVYTGHLVTRNSSRAVESVEVDVEAEEEEAAKKRVPERITAEQGRLRSETLADKEDRRLRRGSEVIYTYHGLSAQAKED